MSELEEIYEGYSEELKAALNGGVATEETIHEARMAALKLDDYLLEGIRGDEEIDTSELMDELREVIKVQEPPAIIENKVAIIRGIALEMSEDGDCDRIEKRLILKSLDKLDGVAVRLRSVV